jgi:type II secretory pathway pseudopilin PulG
MKGRLLVILGFVSTIIFPIFPDRASAATSTSTATVIISEIKLGGDSYSQGADQPKDSQEFITLFNQSNTDIDLSGWVL